MFNTYNFTAVERFLEYVKVDTQSDPHSPTQPSTMKQKDLSRKLVQELQDLGITDAELDEHGYVYATLPSNTDKDVPTICFCSHVDTSPDCSGKDVKPMIHENYQGQDLVLPDDPNQVIRLSDHPKLDNQFGNDIITASGTTLLGADNKAGVAEIMDMVHFFVKNPSVKHGPIRILFTPDEEIGRGVDKVDMEKLNADFGYTVDGEKRGSLEDETFSADAAIVTINGISAHPGFAKGKLVNAIKVAASFLEALPQELSPEATEGREGFLHPHYISGQAEQISLRFILRDFDTSKLEEKAELLRAAAKQAQQKWVGSTIEVEIKEQYRNMKEVLDEHPQVVEYAVEAIKRAGMDPLRSSIRGGTDGSRLSFMGLPCPNIFAGEHAFHSKHEWVSRQDMEKAVMTCVHIACLWEENA
jgi:tripeptide aminopeptidase